MFTHKVETTTRRYLPIRCDMIVCVTSVLLRFRCCRCCGRVDRYSITPESVTPVPSRFKAAKLGIAKNKKEARRYILYDSKVADRG